MGQVEWYQRKTTAKTFPQGKLLVVAVRFTIQPSLVHHCTWAGRLIASPTVTVPKHTCFYRKSLTGWARALAWIRTIPRASFKTSRFPPQKRHRVGQGTCLDSYHPEGVVQNLPVSTAKTLPGGSGHLPGFIPSRGRRSKPPGFYRKNVTGRVRALAGFVLSQGRH